MQDNAWEAHAARVLGDSFTDDVRRWLEERLALGRATWPAIALSPQTYVAALLAQRDVERPVLASLTALSAADLYLATACAGGDAEALASFDSAYLRRVPVYLARLHPSDDFADEVRQLAAAKLLVGNRPKIADYSGRGPLGGWVRVVCLRIAIDLSRRAAARPSLPSPSSPAADLDGELMRARYHEAFRQAFELAISGLPRRERRLLRMYFVESQPLDQVAARLGVHRMTVMRRVAAARRTIMLAAQQALRARLKLADGDFESLFRVLRSQLDLSIATLLR